MLHLLINGDSIMARKTTTTTKTQSAVVPRVEVLNGLFLAWNEATGKVASIVSQIGQYCPITHEEFLNAALPEWVEEGKDGTKKLSGAGRIAKMRINKALATQGVEVGIMPSHKAAETNGKVSAKAAEKGGEKADKGGRPSKVGKEERTAIAVAVHRIEKLAAFLPQDKQGELILALQTIKAALKLS